ncbi:MAG: hypothetical protein J6C98_06990 [Oscillospiraceae bacterium]|nr:hypothetical protein [Oscillospiraceae bacterium]MBO5014568.1 hypothetical protein [Bacteroidaceae bacterium]
MFNHVGRELKNWARVIVILLTVPAVIIGFLLLVTFAYEDMLLLGLIIGILVPGLGYFFARLAAIMLYAYGELVDRAESIDNKMELSKGKESSDKVVSNDGSGWNANAFSTYK